MLPLRPYCSSTSDYKRHSSLYASKAPRPNGCVHIPKMTEFWDELTPLQLTPGRVGTGNSYRRDRSNEVLRMLDADFLLHPTWNKPGHHSPLKRSAFTTWSEDIDPFCGGVHPTIADRTRDQTDLKNELDKVLLGGTRTDTFIDLIATALENNQVVSVAMPAGWGKSITSLAIFRELIKREEEGREVEAVRSGRVYDYGAIRRKCAEMEKAIHMAPTPSNVVSVVQYLKKLTNHQSSFTGLINQTMDFEGRVHGDFDGKDYIVVPYTDAERVLATGRFKLIILDEAHADVTAISTCMLRALDAMGGAEEDALCFPAIRKRRVNKILILRGVRSTALDSELESLIANVHGLRYVSLVLPSASDSDWDSHRRLIRSCCLHSPACACPERTSTTLATNIANRLAAMSDDHLKSQDEPLVGGVHLLPACTMSRLLQATRELMADLIDRVERSPPGNLRFGTIIVFVPTRGAGDDLKSRMRSIPENKVFSRNGVDSYWPYYVKVCSNQHDLEKELTEEAFTHPNWTGRPYDRINNRYMGKVVIIVNGAERGITIPGVGGIVESGMEWVRTPHNRHGFNTNLFILSDRELVSQRKGRGGRTRDTSHVLCLSPWGRDQLDQRGSSIMMRMRSSQLTQADFVRLVSEPRLHTSPLLRAQVVADFCTEGRVNGTLTECEGKGCPHEEKDTVVAYANGVPIPNAQRSQEDLMDVTEEARTNIWIFSGLDPALSKLMLQFIACKLTAYGLIKVAMLQTGETGLAKPSARPDEVGPTSTCNALDIFIKGNAGSVRQGNRRPRRYTGDSAALVELHMQLIAAVGWNFYDEVPTREQLLQARPFVHNFCSADFLNHCMDQDVLKRMDHKKKNENLDIQFILRLFSDQERTAIWSAARKILQDAYAAGILPSLSDANSYTYNERVHSLMEDPILSMEGRALFNAVLAAGSTRFAKVIRAKLSKADGAGKTGAYTSEFYDESGQAFKLTRSIRAEASWDLGRWDTEEWIRFDATNTSRKDVSGVNEKFIVIADPMTEWQLVLFGNLNGRWRVFPVNTEDEACTRWRLEVETNACCALFGFAFEETEDVMRALLNFRTYAASALQHYRDLPNNSDRDAALTAIAQLWNAASPERNDPLPILNYLL